MKDIKIIFEDDNVLLLNKPAGLACHFDGRTKGETVVDYLKKKYKNLKDIGDKILIDENNTIDRYGMLHRLDRETSGLLVIAKNEKSYKNLKKQFEERTIGKIYNAFCLGIFTHKTGLIDKSISRQKVSGHLFVAGRGGRGKEREAVTQYKVLKENQGISFVEVLPKTGRTHQIRVHFKSVSHPILGDELYGVEESIKNKLKFKRVALHSRSIAFNDLNGERKYFEAEYPKDFLSALKKFQ